jgi:hypothetical protein
MADLKQRINEDRIIYQNQSHLVQKYFEMCGICPDLEDLFRVTDLFVLYVKHGKNESLDKSIEAAQKYINDKYKQQ